MQEEINIIPFICEAFATNKYIYKDIDEIYNKDRMKYNAVAKSSEFYNHPFSKEGSILQEYYFKIMLGIILEASKSEKLTEEITNKLIKKGWKHAYNYVMSNSTIDLNKFMARFIKKNKGLDNIADDYLNSNVVIIILLCNIYEKNIIENEMYEFVINNYITRLNLMKFKDEMKSIDKLPSEIRNQLKQIEENLKQDQTLSFRPLEFKGQIKENNRLEIDLHKLTALDKYLLCFEYIYDYENLSLISIVGDDYLDSREIQELIYTYKRIFPGELKENELLDIIKYLYPAIQIRYLCKEYQKAKKVFFDNYSEELTHIINDKDQQIEKLILEIEDLKETNNALSNKNKDFLKTIEQLERENNRLKKELKGNKDNLLELNSLREFIFNLDRKEAYPEIEDIQYEKIKECTGVIIGGHENWQKKMKELLPKFKFIHTDNLNFDTAIFDNINHVFIYTNYLSHGLYYKVINELRNQDNIAIHYLSYNINTNIVLKQIYESIKTSIYI